MRTKQRAENLSSLGRMLRALKMIIFIELDDVSCEQDDKRVRQTKLTEGLKEQEKEANDWEKKRWMKERVNNL